MIHVFDTNIALLSKIWTIKFNSNVTILSVLNYLALYRFVIINNKVRHLVKNNINFLVALIFISDICNVAFCIYTFIIYVKIFCIIFILFIFVLRRQIHIKVRMNLRKFNMSKNSMNTRVQYGVWSFPSVEDFWQLRVKTKYLGYGSSEMLLHIFRLFWKVHMLRLIFNLFFWDF